LEDRAQDNIAGNFVVGITIAQEILEHYGSVLHMSLHYLSNALLQARTELSQRAYAAKEL